jgi:AcrR family transcriptional regulator
MPSPAATIDRRVARTRQTLQQALLALMLKKGYDAISVEEICAEADVGRSTFYAHFTGKDDLRRTGLDTHLRKMLLEHQRQPGASSTTGRFGFVLPLLEHAQDHLALYRALVSKGGAPTTLAMIGQIVTELVRRDLSETAREESPEALPREVTVQFMAGALMALLTWWLDGSAKLPPRRVDAIFRRLATEGIARAGGPVGAGS